MSKYFLKLLKTENCLNKATLISWFKEIGDVVEKGEPILKISVEQEESVINSQFSGKLKETRFDKGDIISVGDVIAEIENDEIDDADEIEDGESFNDLKNDTESLIEVKSVSVIKSGIFYFISLAMTVTIVALIFLQYNKEDVIEFNKDLISQNKKLDVKSAIKQIIRPSSTQTINLESLNVEDDDNEEIPITKQIKTQPSVPEIIEIVEDDEETEETIIESTETNQHEVIEEEEMDIPFAIVDEVPLFPGCEKVGKPQRRQCFQEKMQEHISKYFRYPEIAQEMGIQGRVFVQFMIEKDGNISEIITRGPDKNLEKEANRIISLLPKMLPGKQRGRTVRVPFSIPVTFRLN